MTRALTNPLEYREEALHEASLLLAFMSNLYDDDGRKADRLTPYSDDAETGRISLLFDLSRITGAIGRAVSGKPPLEYDGKPLDIIDSGTTDKLIAAQRFTRLLADHFLNCGDPMTFGKTGMRGLGLLMDIVSTALDAVDADYQRLCEESKIASRDEERRESEVAS